MTTKRCTVVLTEEELRLIAQALMDKTYLLWQLGERGTKLDSYIEVQKHINHEFFNLLEGGEANG